MTDQEKRDKKAKRAALEVYAAAHDHFAEQEQLAKGRGRFIEAEGYHVYAVQALRAWTAETNDPHPRAMA